MNQRKSLGQALTEFVLIMPIFLLLLLGIVQLSLIYFAYQITHHASFTAARAAAVRPCAAFQPTNRFSSHFTPSVFTAAVLTTMTAAPAQPVIPAALARFGFMPDLPVSNEITGLDFQPDGFVPVPNIPDNKYDYATYLTAVRRVYNLNMVGRPVLWWPYPAGAGPGPGAACGNNNIGVQRQNVPDTDQDITIEVTFIYPMIMPLINRVIYGIYVNYSAPGAMGLNQILGGGPIPEEEVMVFPTKNLVAFDRQNHTINTMEAFHSFYDYNFNYPVGQMTQIAQEFYDNVWYPIPIRARCTLTVEGAQLPLTR